MEKAIEHRPAETRGQVIDLDRFRNRPAGHAPPPLPMMEFGSGWYHDAAIEEVGKVEPKGPVLRLVQ